MDNRFYNPAGTRHMTGVHVEHARAVIDEVYTKGRDDYAAVWTCRYLRNVLAQEGDRFRVARGVDALNTLARMAQDMAMRLTENAPDGESSHAEPTEG